MLFWVEISLLNLTWCFGNWFDHSIWHSFCRSAVDILRILYKEMVKCTISWNHYSLCSTNFYCVKLKVLVSTYWRLTMGDGATIANKLLFETFSAKNKQNHIHSFLFRMSTQSGLLIFLSVGKSEQQVAVTVNKQQFKLGKISFWPKTLPAFFRFEAEGSGSALKLPLTSSFSWIETEKNTIYKQYITKTWPLYKKKHLHSGCKVKASNKLKCLTN